MIDGTRKNAAKTQKRAETDNAETLNQREMWRTITEAARRIAYTLSAAETQRRNTTTNEIARRHGETREKWSTEAARNEKGEMQRETRNEKRRKKKRKNTTANGIGTQTEESGGAWRKMTSRTKAEPTSLAREVIMNPNQGQAGLLGLGTGLG